MSVAFAHAELSNVVVGSWAKSQNGPRQKDSVLKQLSAGEASAARSNPDKSNLISRALYKS